MKNLLKILVVALLFLSGCSGNKHEPYYLFETAEYCDFDDSLGVIYIKSHRQLIEVGSGTCSIPDVYNAFGHKASEYRITIDTTDYTYDITLHLHLGNDSTVWITSEIKLLDLKLTRYYMISNYQEPDIFQFLDPLNMTKEVVEDGNTYMIALENYKDIDFKHGERVVLEYEEYKIPVPYQIFEL
jgi:hypothetical protein